jgi:hypothetical protein
MVTFFEVETVLDQSPIEENHHGWHAKSVSEAFSLG